MKNPTERAIVHLVVATGIASVVTQLVLVREFLAQFQGNELIIAVILFNWLLLGGVGTRLAQAAGVGRTEILARLSLLLVVVGVVQVLAIRWLRPVVFVAGASVGFYAALGFSLVVMAPYAMLVGYLLPYSLQVIRGRNRTFPGVSIYMADNLGDLCGGALFTFALVVWATPMMALCLAHLPLVVVCMRLCPTWQDRLAGGLAVALVLLAGLGGETDSLAPAAGRLTHYEESFYGRLTVSQDQEQTTLFADGRPMAGTQNQMAAEQIVHYALCQVDAPKRVMLVSASGGVLEEIAKYRPEAVDYLELDPAVSRLMFTLGLEKAFPWVHVVNADGRAWLRNTRNQYDAVVINLPEPDTFQINRFYTDRFFALVAERLTPQGVFSFSVEGAANYLTDAQRAKLASLMATAKRHFTVVRMLPGERIFFLCRQIPVTLDIPKRLAAAGVATRFVGPFFHGDITPDRIASLNAAVAGEATINRDWRPCLMRVTTAQWFTKFGASPIGFIIVLAAIGFIYLLRMRREEMVLFSTGVLAMGSEMVLIFAFQIYLGYVYAKIGMLVTAFLAGLLPGAWLGSLSRQSARTLMVSDAVVIALLLAVTVTLFAFGSVLPAAYFYLSGFVLSLACGFQVPLALFCLGDDRQAASRIFSVDLVGAALGALATGTILIPYLGLGGAVAVLIGIKLIGMAVMGGRYVRH